MAKNRNSIEINSAKGKPRIVDWQITNNCNYDCSYCPKDKKGLANLKNPSKFLKRIKTDLPGSWEFIISGGEPFAQPNFLEIVQKLIKMGHSISVVTNFSAPLFQIKKFCKITNGRLNYFTASLHLGHANPDAFLRKAINIKKLIFYPSTFSVVSVATKDKLKILGKIGKRFIKSGIKFSLQPFKIQEQYYINYSYCEKRIITSFGRKFGLERPNFRGRKCRAGCQYFILGHDGEAYRCYSTRMKNKEYLGNILDGTFKLWEKPKPCQHEICVCITPFRRGLIETKNN